MTASFWQEIVITNIARRNLVLNKQAMCLLVKINIYSNALPFSENFRLAKIFGENSQSETNLFPFTQNPSRAWRLGLKGSASYSTRRVLGSAKKCYFVFRNRSNFSPFRFFVAQKHVRGRLPCQAKSCKPKKVQWEFGAKDSPWKKKSFMKIDNKFY